MLMSKSKVRKQRDGGRGELKRGIKMRRCRKRRSRGKTGNEKKEKQKRKEGERSST